MRELDHFKDIDDLLKHIDIWYETNDIDYTRWFGLEELKALKEYIIKLREENKHIFANVNDDMLLRSCAMYSKENENLNNILTELEEWIKSEYNRYLNDKENLVFSNVEVIDFGRVLDKIQELKEKYNVKD